MNIRCRCQTNLDEYHRVNWPNYLCCKPEIGDRVKSINHNKILKIVGITHRVDDGSTGVRGPYLEIELHKER